MDAAGPSKPKGPHPSRKRESARKLCPPAPAPTKNAQPTLPLKVLQGAGTQRTDSTRPGFGRETLFVTRKTKLGALIGRARTLIMDEGYTHVTLYALSAAIPHALLLLHALLDVLPFPSGPGGIWYEINTDTVECVDMVDVFPEDDEFGGLGAIEEDEPERRVRNKSSIRIELHIAPRKQREQAPSKRKPGTKARPTANKRKAAAGARKAQTGHMGVDVGQVDVSMTEEEMMNV